MTTSDNFSQPRSLDSSARSFNDRLNKAGNSIWNEIGQDLQNLSRSVSKLGTGSGDSGPVNTMDFSSQDNLYGEDAFHPSQLSCRTSCDNTCANQDQSAESSCSNNGIDISAALKDISALITDLLNGDKAALSHDLAQLQQDLTGDASGATNDTTASGSDGSSDTPTPEADSGSSGDNPAPISLNDMLDMQDKSKNNVVPGLGVVQRGFGWANGATAEPPVPDAANLEVPWMTAFPIDGEQVNADAKISVNNMNSYALLKDGTWHKLTTNNKSDYWGEINPPDFTAIQNLPITENADGSMTVGAPPNGSVDQFGPGGGGFDRSQLVGFYQSAQVKANMDNSGLAVQLGGDVYSTDPNSGGTPVGDNYYLTGWGTSNWLKLNSQYQTIALSNIDAATLAKNPPPGVV